MTRLRPVARALAALLLAVPVAAQPRPATTPAPTATPLELDHIILLVPPGAQAGVARLRAAGFNIANEPQRHVGQGTASMGVLLGNAYLELLWIDSTVRRDASNGMDIARWRKPGVASVGIGLRRAGVPPAPPPRTDAQGVPIKLAPRPMPVPGVASRSYSAPWMPPGTAILLLRQPAESLAAELFVVQDEIALPWWIAQVHHEAPILLQHPGGWRRVRRVVVHGPATQAPAALAQLHPARVEWKLDVARWVEVELEGGSPARTVDLRPTLPLVLRR